ncbi:MAG TPA: iron ABC transporter permease [Trueperaceae bacterium]
MIATATTKRQFRGRPGFWLGLGLAVLLALLVVVPLARILLVTVDGEGISVWRDVLTGRIARNLFWLPLRNTLVIGLLVGLGSSLVGGFLAWLVVLTDIPGRKLIGTLASLPFVIPSFAIALAWQVFFRNERVGGTVGIFTELGMAVPDWLAWGFMPIVVVLITHYFSLSYLLISAGLTSVGAEMIEAAELTGAGRTRILRSITLPVILPSILAGGLLAFAEGVGNFATPALLGLPVRFHTLSTRLYGMISTGQVERGYVLSILLIVIAAALLWAGNRYVSGRRSYATITGKGSRTRRFALGRWKWPLFGVAITIGTFTTILPGIALLFSSLSLKKGSMLSGLTLHYWFGTSDPSIAQGQAGVLRNPQVLSALGTTVALGLAVALAAVVVGLLLGYATSRLRGGWLGDLIGQLAYLPILIPGIALGAAYIALFGQSIGPLPALYGTFALLVIAGAAYNLPFSSQAGSAAMRQVSGELEEAARITGARLTRRLRDIFVPLTAPGLIAGGVLVFVKMVRDLSLVVLLYTPATPLLSVTAFRYANEGFLQFANAITIIIASISVVMTLLAQYLQRRSQPWAQR